MASRYSTYRRGRTQRLNRSAYADRPTRANRGGHDHYGNYGNYDNYYHGHHDDYYGEAAPPRQRMGCLQIALIILLVLIVGAIVTALIISFIASTKMEVVLDGHSVPTIAATVGERRAHFTRATTDAGTHSRIIVYPRDSWGTTLTTQDLQAYAQQLSQNHSFTIINSSSTTGTFSAVRQLADGRIFGVQVSQVRGTVTIIYALTDGIGMDSLLNQFGGLGNLLGDANEEELRERARELTEGMDEREIRALIDAFLGR